MLWIGLIVSALAHYRHASHAFFFCYQHKQTGMHGITIALIVCEAFAISTNDCKTMKSMNTSNRCN